MTKAIVLCAGLGTRFRPYTNFLAKPAIDFLTIPQLAYSVYPMQQLGIEHFLFNTHHLPETVEQAASRILPSENFTLSHETEILGSAGAIANNKDFLQDSKNFFVLNGDSVSLFRSINDLKTMHDQHIDQWAYASLLLTPHPDAGKTLSAAWVNHEGHIKGFGLTPPGSNLSPYHYTGFLLFNERAMGDMQPIFSNTLYDVITPAIQRGEIIRSVITEDIHIEESGNLQDYIQYHENALNMVLNQSPYGQYLQQVLQHFNVNLKVQKSDPNLILATPPDGSFVNKNSAEGFIITGSNSHICNHSHCKNVVFQSNTIEEINHPQEGELILSQQ